jgi:hypothetical protein
LYLQYQCEDVLGDGQLLDALGVGLGRTDMVNVALAVKKLGEDPKKNVDTVGAARDTTYVLRQDCHKAATCHSRCLIGAPQSVRPSS